MSAQDVAQRDAITAYKGFVEAWVAAAKVSDPDAPALRRYAHGRALKMVVTAMFGNRMQGKVVLGQPVINPRAVDAQPAAAPVRVTLSDCVDDRNWLEYKASDKSLWDDIPGGRRLARIVVVKTSAGWKVDVMTAKAKGSC